MGAKTGYAHAILHALGLRQGQGHTDGTRYLWCEPDAGVRLLLHAYTDRELAQSAARIIRGWKDEDPRALWGRLRAEGPAQCPEGLTAREVARWVLLGVWSYRKGDPASGYNAAYVDGHATTETHHGSGARAVHMEAAGLDSTGTLPASIVPDARAVDPREVARWVLGGVWSYRQGEVESGFIGPGQRRQDTTATATATARVAMGIPAAITEDARAIEPVDLPAGTVAYMDPPYLGTTQYAHLFPREEWLPVVRRWREAGALVCVSEAEPIAELVAEGWHALDITGTRKGQKRTFSKQKREWLTMSEPPRWEPSVQMSLLDDNTAPSRGAQ